MSIGTTGFTTEQLLALPEDDGIEREIIRGELKERPLTKRNRFHSFCVAKISQFLGQWLDSQPQPRGEIHAGEVGVILARDPDSTVGIDVAYFSAETMAEQNDDSTMVQGVPLLAVEVLSPSDKVEEVRQKVNEYLRVKIAAVWVVDPYFQTISVHRKGVAPVTFNAEQQMDGGDVFEGLRFPVADVFTREFGADN